jgi:hypothetical protein
MRFRGKSGPEPRGLRRGPRATRAPDRSDFRQGAPLGEFDDTAERGMGASSQSRAQEARPRCPPDACAVRSAVFERTEERLRGGATPNDEVRCDQDRRPARPAGVAPREGVAGEPAHRHHQPDPRLFARTWRCCSARDYASFATSCRAFSLRPPTLCRHAWCASSKIWQETGAGSTSASRVVERDRNHRAVKALQSMRA